jgi:hypothetical protein
LLETVEEIERAAEIQKQVEFFKLSNEG